MQTSPKPNYDARTLDYFDSEVLSRADLVYRFGMVLTGSQETAFKLVQATFQFVSREFVKFIRIKEFNITGYLLAECWRIYSTSAHRPAFKDWGGDVGSVIGQLSLDSRVALYAVDVAGLSPADAARALGSTEKDIRLRVAAARRDLLALNGA